MSDPIHRELSVDGVRLHLVEQGEGPAVLLCHGYPECWYSWRHQLPALAAAGYRAIALDMRGYGESDSPPGIEDYTVLRLVGDLVGVLDALGIESAVVAGHDWGAVVAWHAALLRADRFPAVIALSVPFIPRGQVSTSRKLPETEHEVFYQLYFQEPGVAEADYERDTRGYLRGLLFATSGDMPPPAEGEPPRRPGMVPRTGRLPYSGPAVLPAWLGEADVDVYTAAFARNGFRGPLNWYPQYRAQLADAGCLRGAQGGGAGALYRRRARPGAGLQGQFGLAGGAGAVGAAPGAHGAPARLRALDPAGAARRGQSRDAGLPGRGGLGTRLSLGLATPGARLLMA